MPDLMKTPSNRRYVVNFQQKEPINKYDIWLSFNKHNLDGNVVIDSEYLSDKDLVFKVFVNGKWVPILGIPVSYEGIIQALEELDKKKMNIVPPTEWEAGDIAIFQQGSDECDQLVSGGTLEEMLQTIINDGGAIPIQRATTLQLGGIKAAIHSSSQLTDTYVEAKFKGVEGATGENDRLYISASEIVAAINNIGGGVDILLMGPNQLGGAKANYTPLDWSINHFMPVLVRTVDEMLYVSIDDLVTKIIALLGNSLQIYQEGEGIDITGNTISIKTAEDNELGGVRARPIVKALGNVGAEISKGNGTIQDVVSGRVISNKHLLVGKSQIQALLTYNDDNSMFRDGFGIYAEPHQEYNPVTQEDEFYWTFNLEHTNPTDWGKVLQIKSDGSGIEWVPMSGGQTYDPLSINSVYGTNYVVAAPYKKEGFLKWDGTFESIPAGSSVSWNEYQLTGTKIADITINGVTTDIYAPSANTYYSGSGIYIDNTNHINIATNGANPNDVLSYNGSGFSWVPQTSYTQKEGVVIDNTNHTIGGMITTNSTSYSADVSITFNCTVGSVQNPITGIEMVLDGVSNDLLKYSYSEIFIKPTNSITLTFNIQNQKQFMQGIPIYVLLEIDGKSDTVEVQVANSDSLGLININEAVTLNSSNNSALNPLYTKYLITMQFGIVRIEPLEGTTTNNDNDDNE